MPRLYEPVRARSVSDALRRAIRQSGMSRKLIAHRAKVDKGQLSRFLNRKGSLGLEAVDRIASVINWPLEIPQVAIIVTSRFRGRLCEFEYRERTRRLPAFLAVKPLGEALDWEELIPEFLRHGAREIR